jgi:hypothetical protein
MGPCLRSIRPWADEIIVADTGSKDDTPKLAAKLGARVFHFPWCDSFSRARNESLRRARGQWIFWMDTDDTIDKSNGRKLRALVEGMIAHPEQEIARHHLAEPRKQGTDVTVLGFVMQVHCPGGPDEADSPTVVDHVKLFRNLPGLFFSGRIHEQIIPAIRRAGGEIAWTDIFVVHSGYDHSPEGQERKKQRDLRLLHLELKEQREHPFTLFNLGMTYADIGQHREAIGFLQHSIRNSGRGESHLRKAYAILVHSLQQLGQLDEAWRICREALTGFADDPELLFRKALVLHALGKSGEAVKAYHDLLKCEARAPFQQRGAGHPGLPGPAQPGGGPRSRGGVAPRLPGGAKLSPRLARPRTEPAGTGQTR